MSAFADRLCDAIDRCKAPVCVGIDPSLENLPPSVRDRCDPGAPPMEAAVDAIHDFCSTVLQTVGGQVPIVKLQSAFFEKYRWEGVGAYYSLIRQARELGLLVIGDVKRGDISSTADAYAAGHLEEDGPDAITINPMLGMDTVQTFAQAAARHDKGLFVLVRTSNPGSATLQDAALADGRTWSELLADHLNPLAGEWLGERGYSAIGAVVGATQQHTIVSLRRRLPRSIFLLPGYGAQGAKAEQTRAAFIQGRGAIVSASRSILYAHAEPRYADRFGNNWPKCIAQAVADMKEDLARMLNS